MKSRSIVNFFQIASLLLLLVTVGLLSAITTVHFAIHGAEVQVPALKGLTVANARSETAGLGLNLNVDNRYYSADVAAGHILTQSPAAGTVVRRQWQVRVAESLGPQKADVPDAVGSNSQAAQFKLRRAGLEVGTIAELPTAGAQEGTVIAQDPPAHAQDIERPTVSLLVAAPDDEASGGFVMPDLAGFQAASAQGTLARAGFTSVQVKFVEVPVAPVGSGNAMPTLPVKPGSVLLQTPPAGSHVDRGTVVSLTAVK
jgi:eukaryotic-like serine/threonine-protein kinase